MGRSLPGWSWWAILSRNLLKGNNIMDFEKLGTWAVAFTTATAAATWLASCLAPVSLMPLVAMIGSALLTPAFYPLASYILKGDE